ncbi:MAG: 50S ribosomal protein L15 [Desulfatiglandales bacterium]
MRIHDLHPAEGSRRKRKRIGRGQGSGRGTTSGKGHKGQRARAGGGPRPGFEGGQMPITRRIPKRGFYNPFKVTYEVVNLGSLNKFEPGSFVGIEELKGKGLIKKGPVKLLAKGGLDRPLQLEVHRASQAAVEKVMAQGGSVNLIG